jgi:hypothetical protein
VAVGGAGEPAGHAGDGAQAQGRVRRRPNKRQPFLPAHRKGAARPSCLAQRVTACLEPGRLFRNTHRLQLDLCRCAADRARHVSHGQPWVCLGVSCRSHHVREGSSWLRAPLCQARTVWTAVKSV